MSPSCGKALFNSCPGRPEGVNIPCGERYHSYPPRHAPLGQPWKNATNRVCVDAVLPLISFAFSFRAVWFVVVAALLLAIATQPPAHAITLVGLAGLPDQGVFNRGDMRMYVTRCVGFYGYPMRIGIPPEIALLVVRGPRRGTAT